MLGAWHGKALPIEPEVLQSLQLSDYWLADYSRDGDKAPVNFFYIAYYATQHVGSMAHSPSNCIPGSGWQIVSRKIKTVTLPDQQSVTVSRLLIQKASIKQVVYYWLDERGRDMTETSEAKWYLLRDAITMHRTDGALIRLVTPLADGESEADAEKRLDEFLARSTRSFKTLSQVLQKVIHENRI